ncbi:MAG: hypothetical protein IPL10_12415 [Bacteroidetes bacterium]|nr:hypothetical protein [Bacteroidota bacterium]
MNSQLLFIISRNGPINKINYLKNFADVIVKKNIEEINLKLSSYEASLPNKIKELAEKQEQHEKDLALGSEGSDKYIFERITRLKAEIEETKSFIEDYIARIEKLKANNDLGELPIREKIKVTNKTWEFPVTAQSSNPSSGYRSSKNIIGFIDLKITISFTQLSLTGIDFDKRLVTGDIKWS